MSNLPPLPVICDTPPPIDDFSNIPDDDYTDYDGIGDDYGIVIEDHPRRRSFQATQSIIVDEQLDEEVTPYLGTRLPPDGTDITLVFPGDTNTERSMELEFDSPPSLNLSNEITGQKIEIKDDDFITKQVIDNNSCSENGLEKIELASQQQLHDSIDRHIEGGSDQNDEFDETINECHLTSGNNLIQENLSAKQLNIDKALDDLTDFQSLSVDKCKKCNPDLPVINDDFTFDVDLGNFKVDFSKITPDNESSISNLNSNYDSFDNFQNFCSARDGQELYDQDNSVITEKLPVKKEVLDELDEDDDFGDFQTNNIVPAKRKQEVSLEPLATFTLEAFKKIVGLMFPFSSSFPVDDNDKSSFDAIPFDKNIITSKLKVIELSRALGYRYANSISSKALMESIGIDSKNVLFGMKWNPGMPRYAANLSFDPLQPQPLVHCPVVHSSQVFATTSASKSNDSKNMPTSIIQKSCNKDESVTQVPAARFDWSSAGLVNPLDGSSQIPATKSTAVIDSVSSNTGTQLPTNAIINEAKISPLIRTITLPETHIFTPEKCTNAISQSVNRNAISTIGGEVTTSSIVVKEYRDVEYKLDKSLINDCIRSKSDNSISENSVLHHFTSLSQPILAAATPIDPIIDDVSSKMYLKPDVMQEGLLHNTTSHIGKDNFPIFCTSHTDIGEKKSGDDDDDFSDFQTAPIEKPILVEPKAIQASALLNPLPLSPVHLMRSATNSTLPEPDADEMVRIEAFARSKSQCQAKSSSVFMSKINKNIDDDEWSDFTSAVPVSSQQKSNTTNKKNTSHDGDWLDYVFTTATSMKPIITNNHHQTQKQHTGNFSSWNHQQDNYMPWNTNTRQTSINYDQTNESTTSMQQPSHQYPANTPELNFIQSQKSFVNTPNQLMRK